MFVRIVAPFFSVLAFACLASCAVTPVEEGESTTRMGPSQPSDRSPIFSHRWYPPQAPQLSPSPLLMPSCPAPESLFRGSRRWLKKPG